MRQKNYANLGDLPTPKNCIRVKLGVPRRLRIRLSADP